MHGLHLCLNVLLAHGPNYKIRFLKYFGRIEATKPRTTKLSAISKIDLDPSKSSVAKTEQHSDPFERIASQQTSLAIEKHGKHKKLARLDFSGAKGVAYLSKDDSVVDNHQIITKYCSINKIHQDAEDQTPTSEKGGETTIYTSHGPIEAARPPTEGARPPPLVLTTTDASLDDSSPVVNCLSEKKVNIMQIMDTRFSNMINKVQIRSFSPNSQYSHIFQLIHLLVIFFLVVLKDRLGRTFYLLMMK